MIYTMGIKHDLMKLDGFDRKFEYMKKMLKLHFGACELLLCTDTLQYSDYDKYESEMFDKEAKKKRHNEVFPKDCHRAYELGVRMASGIVPNQEET
jgi:hypothetical protein